MPTLIFLTLGIISLHILFAFLWFKGGTVSRGIERIFWTVTISLVFIPLYVTVFASYTRGLGGHDPSLPIVAALGSIFISLVLFILPLLISLEVLVSNIKNYKVSSVFDKLAGLSAIPSTLLFLYMGFVISSMSMLSPSPGGEPAMAMVGGLFIAILILGGLIFYLPMLILMFISRVWKESRVWTRRLSILLGIEVVLFLFLLFLGLIDSFTRYK